MFVASGREGIIGPKYVAGAPDLVIEVLSPSTETRDRILKAKRYAASGVREMWLVDPAARTIEILVNAEDGFRRLACCSKSDQVRSTVLPGLEFPAAAAFRSS